MNHCANTINTLVIGAGQAGIAASEHLSALGISHVVLERARIAESWRSRRWDSLVANGPAWHDRFPNRTFDQLEDHAFASKVQIVEYFESYVRQINAPVHTGVNVVSVERQHSAQGFYVNTDKERWHADHIVVATGAFQTPVIPSIAPVDQQLMQLHSAHYRNPQQLPEGAVLVVGAGSSGVQIAEELHNAGRTVFLSVGPHHRPPRAYRQRDYCWWLGVLGEWDKATPAPGTEHVTIAVSGFNGGHTIDFRRLARRGIRLLGMASGFKNGIASFNNDLKHNVILGDENYLQVLQRADKYVAENGLDLPEEPEAHTLLPDPPCIANPQLSVDLEKENVNAIVWATGYSRDFSWIHVDAFDEHGAPEHERGVSSEPGLYFLGLPWLSRRGSSFIWGVWHDALYIANHIRTQNSYAEHAMKHPVHKRG